MEISETPFQSRNVRGIAVAGGALLALSYGLYLAGYINQNIAGEAFYDFHYADRFSLLPSIKVFFFNRVRARLGHGVFVSALYELLGYNPPVFFLIIQQLVFGSAIFIVLSVKDFIKQSWLGALMVISLALLPLNVHYLVFLKNAHHVASWFMFWAATYFFIRWTTQRHGSWLFLSGMLFVLSVLTYEVTVALLPVAFFLSFQNFKKLKELVAPLIAVIVISILAAALLFVVEGVKPSGGLFSFYGDIGEQSKLLGIFSIPNNLALGVWEDGLMGLFYSAPSLVSVFAKILIVGALSISLTAIFFSLYKEKKRLESVVFFEPTFLLAAGLWLGIFGALPHHFANQGIEADSLRGAAFGLLIISIAAHWWIKQKGRIAIASIFLASVGLFWIGIGSTNYINAYQERVGLERIIDNFVFSLKQEVPFVKENTTFIYVNASLGRTGCIGMMNMLYSRDKVQCIHLMDSDSPDSYFREEGLVREDTGREYEEDFIILTFDAQGYVAIIEELTPDTYPTLPLNWQSEAPILTNRSRILLVEEPGSRVSQFYEYMLARRIEMGWPDAP